MRSGRFDGSQRDDYFQGVIALGVRRWKNPSPGWERGRGEGPPLIAETRRSRCAAIHNRQALIRPSGPPSPIREKGRGGGPCHPPSSR
jgi:hypothetical protein